MTNLARLFVIIIILFLFLMGFIPNIPLHLVLRLILIGHNPFNLKRLFNNSQDVGCLWDLPWIVGYMLSIVFIETTAMMFMDSAICSSSIEPNGIGSELEGRPEIFKMDQNPQQPTGDGDREVTSSSSGNWRQYLNLSSDKEGLFYEPSRLPNLEIDLSNAGSEQLLLPLPVRLFLELSFLCLFLSELSLLSGKDSLESVAKPSAHPLNDLFATLALLTSLTERFLFSRQEVFSKLFRLTSGSARLPL